MRLWLTTRCGADGAMGPGQPRGRPHMLPGEAVEWLGEDPPRAERIGAEEARDGHREAHGMPEDGDLGEPAGVAVVDGPALGAAERAGGKRPGGGDREGQGGAAELGAYEPASRGRAEELGQEQGGTRKD